MADAKWTSTSTLMAARVVLFVCFDAVGLGRHSMRGRKFLKLLRVPAYRRALWLGTAAAVEHAQTPLPVRVATVLDVGANRGQFAVHARHRWPNATVISFEPLPLAAARMRALFARDPNVRVEELALGASSGWADLHLSRADDSSSLLPIGAQQVKLFPGTDEVGTTPVRVQRLDDVLAAADLSRPVLLKIDVQGGELGVLQGAATVLGAIDVIICECSWLELYDGQALADDVIAFLDGHGFTQATVASATHHGSITLQGDIVFVRR
jgi:FkbM family methyltransferase